MSQEIAVVGSPEFTTGFRLAGIRRFADVPESEKEEALDEAVTELLEADDVGIVVMHADDLEHLSRRVREDVETSVEPTVVTLGEGSQSGLREQIRRAIGIDLMGDEDDEDTTDT
ncbi:MAG: V-type ATP synthase subunit F [Halobacteriaceae archaeon]